MPTLKIDEPVRKITLDSTTAMYGNTKQVVDFGSIVWTFSNVAPTTKIDMTNPSPGNYQYKLELVDGRSWDQALVILPDQEIKVGYTSITGLWKISEIDLLRDMRECLRTMVLSFGLTMAKVRW